MGLRLREAARMKRAIAAGEASHGPTGARLDRRDAAEFCRHADESDIRRKACVGTGEELEPSKAKAGKKPGLACHRRRSRLERTRMPQSPSPTPRTKGRRLGVD